MELQLEDYWKVVRPQRAKSLGSNLIPSRMLDPLIRWTAHPDDKAFLVLPGSNRDSNLQHLRGSIQREVSSLEEFSDLLLSLVRGVGRIQVHDVIRDELDFKPPNPFDWDLLWCLVACPGLTLAAELMSLARVDSEILNFVDILTDLRFEARERKVLISVEEQIDRLVSLVSSSRDVLFFMLALAHENGLMNTVVFYLDASKTHVGLLKTLRSLSCWAKFGCPLRLIIGCESVNNYGPQLKRLLTTGTDWVLTT